MVARRALVLRSIIPRLPFFLLMYYHDFLRKSMIFDLTLYYLIYIDFDMIMTYTC
jgi:hypothetical protein